MIRNSSSGSQKDEMQVRKSLSDQVDPSKEQGTENASGISNKYSILKMKLSSNFVIICKASLIFFPFIYSRGRKNCKQS